MNLELQKIEATLQELTAQNFPKDEQSFSKTENDRTGELTSLPANTLPERAKLSPRQVEPFLLPKTPAKKIPALPDVKTPRFTSHRNGVNPYLAMNLLKEIENTVTKWQTELRQILRQIQDIYLEGPIVEGWLESESPAMPTQISQAYPISEPKKREKQLSSTKKVKSKSDKNPQTPGYRLVGRDANGKLWSRACPPEELPSISLALARYQKLQQMLVRKQELETKLTQLAEELVFLQGRIQTL